MIPAGQRNQRITIQSPGATVDALGQPIDAPWVDVATVWARARPVRSRERIAADGSATESDVAFGFSWRAGVTSGMRVLWRGMPYSIVGEPADVDGGKHTLEVVCKSGPGAGL